MPVDYSFPQVYTAWDLWAVRECDIVFVYIEKDNPSGIGLALEVGYAKALGKTIIMVNEQQDNRYTHIIEQTADVVFTSFDDGVEFLRNLPHAPYKVYLSGGMRSGWQENMYKYAPNQHYFNPATKG